MQDEKPVLDDAEEEEEGGAGGERGRRNVDPEKLSLIVSEARERDGEYDGIGS